jgi:hypothetical protein
MGGMLIMSIRDQEYGASLDLQQLYPFRGLAVAGFREGDVHRHGRPVRGHARSAAAIRRATARFPLR